MPISGPPPSLPVAATIDLQGRLPPPQQVLYTPTILLTVALLAAGIVLMIYLSHRAKIKARRDARREALKMAKRIVLKRGGTDDDVDKVLLAFASNPKLDPAALIMIRDRFDDELAPIFDENYDSHFRERMERIFFPPQKDTRRALADQSKNVSNLVEEQKAYAAGQNAAALLDLMDAVLRPGTIARLAFEGIEGGFECLVMGHNAEAISVTLPAHNDHLVASLRPGLRIEGTLENGPSLLAFSSAVVQAVAGSMPYCQILPWKSAWEVRKRESVRLPISLEIDFQHISTTRTDAINMSNLHKEIGAIRPGRLIDISLGGCCIETPSASQFSVGDMIRFSKSLVTGNPPATLLGAIVKISDIDPETHEGSRLSLHVQFLVIDDVSQRILVRTLRQLQDIMERDEWIQAQQLMQKMRRNKIKEIGSPAPRHGGNQGTTTLRPASSRRVTGQKP